MKRYRIYITLVILIFSGKFAYSQISPGDLSDAHAHLEGLSNCTQCHTVGEKVTREKCLDCHKEIKSNILAKKGYHASSEVNGKNCASCHNEHHGRKFKLIRFNKKTFNHNKTGFVLKGQHAREDCSACHNAEHIKQPKTQRKTGESYIGLSQSCTSCHHDYHQGKLSARCNDCHSFENWKNAKTYDHNKTRFPLKGRHQSVKCIDCHKTEMINGKESQNFKGLKFANCNACHEDEHHNRFGQNCKQCHSEESFHRIKGLDTFDHDKTDYKLIGKHKLVDCKECHKGAMTAPLKHNRCTDCHDDEHDGQFAVNGVTPDCNECHSNYGFEPGEFTVERHNKTKFKLDGAHVATSCNECHKKDGAAKWQFRKIGTKCVDCHKNEHKGFIDEKYYPGEDCEVCHTTSSWKKINFDHQKTGFKLEGAHSKELCGACHYRPDEKGVRTQKFSALTNNCSQCHKDSHYGQFETGGVTDCTKCHGFTNWEDSKFDHNNSRFKLDGQHVNVKCEECHKPVEGADKKHIQYKFKSIECSECHS